MSIRSVNDRRNNKSNDQRDENKTTQSKKKKNSDSSQKRTERIIDKSVFINIDDPQKDKN